MGQRVLPLHPPVEQETSFSLPIGRGRGRAFLALLLSVVLAHPAVATPRVILILSSIPTLKEAADNRYPNLGGFVRRNGVAAMVVGPSGMQPLASLLDGRYVPDHGRDRPPCLAVRYPDVFALRSVCGRWVMSSGLRSGGTVKSALRDQLARARDCTGLLIVNPGFGPSAAYPRPAAAQEDAVLGAVRAAFPQATVIILSPRGPERIGAPGHVPSWIAMTGGKGLLTSDTTRARGVVSILDVAPTVAGLALGGIAPGMAGHAIRTETHSGTALVETVRLQKALCVLAVAGAPSCAALGVLSAVALIAALAAPRSQRWPGWLLLAAALAPAGMAVAAGMRPQSVACFALGASSLTLGLTIAALALGRLFGGDDNSLDASLLYTALLIVVLFLVADTLSHGMSIRLSPLTALFQTGVRFYGMGNEYVAVFVPASLFLLALTLERAGTGVPSGSTLAVAGAALAGGAAFLGWRGAGANFGGMLTALAAGAVFWSAATVKGGHRRPWVPAALASVAVAVAVVWLDASASNPTHIGAVARSGATGDANAAAAVLRGKAAIALRLVVSPPFLLAVAAGLGLWRLPALRRAVAGVAETHFWCGVAARATVWGGLAALLVNDTGPVMLAVMLMGAAVPMVFLSREPREAATPPCGFTPRRRPS